MMINSADTLKEKTIQLSSVIEEQKVNDLFTGELIKIDYPNRIKYLPVVQTLIDIDDIVLKLLKNILVFFDVSEGKITFEEGLLEIQESYEHCKKILNEISSRHVPSYFQRLHKMCVRDLEGLSMRLGSVIVWNSETEDKNFGGIGLSVKMVYSLIENRYELSSKLQMKI